MADLGLYVVMRKSYEFSQAVERQDTNEVEHSTKTTDAKMTLAEGVQDDMADEKDEESIYHCTFCRMAAMDGGFDASIFCYESSGKGTIASTKQAFDGDNSTSFLSMSDLAKLPCHVSMTKQPLTTLGNDSATMADTISVLEWSSDSFDDMNRSSNNCSFTTIKDSKRNDCDRVVKPSHQQKYQEEQLPCGHTTAGNVLLEDDTKTSQEQACVLPVKKEKLCIIYTWYTCMGQPDHESMKKRICNVHPDISSDDIDRLPWMHNGTRLNIVKMNAICLK